MVFLFQTKNLHKEIINSFMYMDFISLNIRDNGELEVDFSGIVIDQHINKNIQDYDSGISIKFPADFFENNLAIVPFNNSIVQIQIDSVDNNYDNNHYNNDETEQEIDNEPYKWPQDEFSFRQTNDLHIFATNYNILRIMSGMAGLSYSD